MGKAPLLRVSSRKHDDPQAGSCALKCPAQAGIGRALGAVSRRIIPGGRDVEGGGIGGANIEGLGKLLRRSSDFSEGYNDFSISSKRWSSERHAGISAERWRPG